MAAAEPPTNVRRAPTNVRACWNPSVQVYMTERRKKEKRMTWGWGRMLRGVYVEWTLALSSLRELTVRLSAGPRGVVRPMAMSLLWVSMMPGAFK